MSAKADFTISRGICALSGIHDYIYITTDIISISFLQSIIYHDHCANDIAVTSIESASKKKNGQVLPDEF